MIELAWTVSVGVQGTVIVAVVIGFYTFLLLHTFKRR